MVIKTLLFLLYIISLSFLVTLLFAAVFGDVWYIWYENNMLEEYLAIAVTLFTLGMCRLFLTK